MKPKSVHQVLRSIGWWLGQMKDHPSGNPNRDLLLSAWADLVGIVMHHAGVDWEEAQELLRRGYLELWILRVLDGKSGPVEMAD